MASPNSNDISNLLVITRFGTNKIASGIWRVYHTIYLVDIEMRLYLIVTQKVYRNKWGKINTSWHGEAFRITVAFARPIPR